MSARTEHARRLFAPLAASYDRVGAALSLGQDPLWRRYLVRRLPPDRGHVLDVATGTGLVAAELLRRGFRVTGLDQSAEMLESARRRFSGAVEFVIPDGLARPFWDLYVGVGLPLAGLALRDGWDEVGRFLGPSIRGFWSAYPLERQLELWRAAGVPDPQARRLSLGGGVVVW